MLRGAMQPDFDTALVLWLNVAGTFAFGLSGGLAAVRARLDLFGVLVLAAVVAMAGGIVRDLLIGAPPTNFRDERYLVAAIAAGLVCFFGRSAVARLDRGVLVFDALGLSVFCVAGASTALDSGLGPVQAVLLGAVTGIGGGILRDVLLAQVPIVLRQELYAVPAMVGAAGFVLLHEAGAVDALAAAIGAALCLAIRLAGLRFDLAVPTEPPPLRPPRRW
jgi:uncharacterized membrane protein YeiH